MFLEAHKGIMEGKLANKAALGPEKNVTRHHFQLEELTEFWASWQLQNSFC